MIRLDRIGDVVLSTPVIQALRDACPAAFIAMAVRPECRELVEGHPALNTVMLYDKTGRHKSVIGTVRFAFGLRKLRFDTALVLHPTHRSHWIPWLAGIPVRIGYDRKSAWLLTRRLTHRKQEGLRHETEYTLDMARVFGIDPAKARPLVPVRDEHRTWVEKWLAERGVEPGSRLVALHPGASDPVKRWPAERFADLGDRLASAYRIRSVIVGGSDSVELGGQIAAAMMSGSIDASGMLSLGRLATLLSRCCLVISNDSGPVHMAVAVGTSVISLFGRNQPGLGPARWGPVGAGHIALHKDAPSPGRLCADAQCSHAFLPLTELSVDEVFEEARAILRKT